MSELRDGSRISYIGDGSDGRQLGDRGRLLVRSGSNGHVKWDDGAITPHPLDFLAATSRGGPRAASAAPDMLADSLEVGPISHTSARLTYDTDGSVGVLNAMAANGELTSFPEIARDALAMVASRVRQDPDIVRVIGQLDDEEATEVVALASQALLRDAFGDLDG